MTYGSTPLAERRPGAFKAFCKLGAWRDVAEVLAAGSPLEGAYPQRWNKALERSEMLVPCAFQTTDARAFEAHMAEVHGRKLGQLENVDGDWTAHRLPMPSTRPIKVGLRPAGQPLSKSAAEALETCPTCELVAQVTYVSQDWWNEHLGGCALATVGAAS